MGFVILGQVSRLGKSTSLIFCLSIPSSMMDNFSKEALFIYLFPVKFAFNFRKLGLSRLNRSSNCGELGFD